MKKYTFEREELANRLSDGCIIGHTTSSSAKIWVRVAVAGMYTLIVSTQRIKVDPYEIGKDEEIEDYLERIKERVGIRDPILLRHEFNDEKDKTHVFNIALPKGPDETSDQGTTYHYAVVANKDVPVNRRWRFGFEKEHSFQTPPEEPQNITFGYFSCHDPFKKGASGIDLWDDFYDILTEYQASFVIGGGDQIYIDCTKEDIWKWVKENKDQLWDEYQNDKPGLIKYFKTIYRYVYRKYWSFPEVRKVFRSFPMYMMWDDHEIMDGWGSYTDDERSDKLDSIFEWENKEQNLFLVDAMFEAAKAVYVEYQHSHNPGETPVSVDPTPQFDYQFCQGDIGFYALDMRGHRNYAGKDGERILGKNQFDRFKTWIQSDEIQQKKVLFIISPVPVIHWHSTFVNGLDVSIAKDDFRDEWDHESNYTERDKMLDQVFAYSREEGKPIIFLSGDVHCAAVFKLTRSGEGNAKAKVFQFTSSAITHPPAHKIVSLMVLERGKLGHNKDARKKQLTKFEKLLFVARHNFGLIRCKSTKNKGMEIWGHLYSSDNKENELICSRIKLS